MWSWVELGSGIALVAAVFLDVFATVVLPRATHRGARISPLFARLVAPAWARAAAHIRSPRMRQDVRGTLAPVLLVLIIAAWVTTLALGFGLMLYAQPANVRVEDHSFAESFFQAALALSTLGLLDADIEGGARAVVAVAGLAGFATVTLTVTFLLSIQGALHQREMMVLRLPARAGRQPAATTILDAFGEDDEALARFFGDWEEWMAEVMESHLAYPILCLFRSLDEDAEWLICLGAVLDAAALAVAAKRPAAARTGRFLLTTAERALCEFERLMRIAPQEEVVEATVWPAVVVGGPMTPEDERARAALVALRRRYVPRMAALADRLDIAWRDPLAGPLAEGAAF